MKPRHASSPERRINQNGIDGSRLAVVPEVALFASDLTGFRSINPLITGLKSRDGVRQVTLVANGGSLCVTYDPAVTDPETLVSAARALGYGVCIVTLHFDLHCLPEDGRRPALAAALRRSHGVLTAQVNTSTQQLTVMYIPGPTDSCRLREVILRLADTRLRNDRHHRVRRTERAGQCGRVS